MIAVSSIRSIWLAKYKVDFRKGHWSLLAEAYKLGLSPLEGDAVLFIGSDKRKLKIIYSDSIGLWVSYKVFHRSAMKTAIDFSSEPTKSAMTSAELAMMLEGAAFIVHKRMKPYQNESS